MARLIRFEKWLFPIATVVFFLSFCMALAHLRLVVDRSLYVSLYAMVPNGSHVRLYYDRGIGFDPQFSMERQITGADYQHIVFRIPVRSISNVKLEFIVPPGAEVRFQSITMREATHRVVWKPADIPGVFGLQSDVSMTTPAPDVLRMVCSGERGMSIGTENLGDTLTWLHSLDHTLFPKTIIMLVTGVYLLGAIAQRIHKVRRQPFNASPA